MKKLRLHELSAFVAVAEVSSFTRAAAALGVTPSALSHAVKALEARLGVVLLARSTRSVSTTEVGERLLRTMQPALQSIDDELAALGDIREEPSGTVRITTFKHAATSVVMPMLPEFVMRYPKVCVELIVEDAMRDIVAGRFDAGIRFGQSVARDMNAVQVGPTFSTIVVASPTYLAKAGRPEHPRDLAKHQCIVHRVSDAHNGKAWNFRHKARSFTVKVDGQLAFNDVDLVLKSAMAGNGLAYLLDDQVRAHLSSGALDAVLEPYTRRSPGYFLYYPAGYRPSTAMRAFVEMLKCQFEGM